MLDEMRCVNLHQIYTAAVAGKATREHGSKSVSRMLLHLPHHHIRITQTPSASPVQANVREQLVLRQDSLKIAIAISPRVELFDYPCKQPCKYRQGTCSRHDYRYAWVN